MTKPIKDTVKSSKTKDKNTTATNDSTSTGNLKIKSTNTMNMAKQKIDPPGKYQIIVETVNDNDNDDEDNRIETTNSHDNKIMVETVNDDNKENDEEKNNHNAINPDNSIKEPQMQGNTSQQHDSAEYEWTTEQMNQHFNCKIWSSQLGKVFSIMLEQEKQTAKQEKTTEQIKPTTWTGKMDQMLRNLELWHSRMGHVGAQKLYETQKVVDGIPPIPLKPPCFQCPYYQPAKLYKTSGNKESDDESFLPGQRFHMDLAFVSGPSNLRDVFENNTKPKKKIKKSKEGYIGFLAIIDAATRYLWV